jgi:hypothetical protein
LELLKTLIDRQLILLPFKRQPSLANGKRQWSDISSMPMVYSCPLGLILASQLSTSPPAIVEDLGNLLEQRNKIKAKSMLTIYLDSVSSGWFNFYFDHRAIASWLERSLYLTIAQSNDNPLTVSTSPLVHPQKSSDLFSVQYVHARCCSLLRLGARENLVALVDENFDHLRWPLLQPSSISWLNDKHSLRFGKLSEYNLLRRLLITTDCQIANNDQWSKLALDLSQATAIFQADCRFLGEIKKREPQKAIARLGLTALAQYWLQRILVEKLNIAAPTVL